MKLLSAAQGKTVVVSVALSAIVTAYMIWSSNNGDGILEDRLG